MKKYYVIFDTNVIVSALFDSSISSFPSQLLNLVYDKTITPVFSNEILDEYKEVLSRDKFPFTKKEVGDFINYIKKIGIIIDPESLNIDFLDEDDLMFYEVLMNKDNYDKKLVTGNIKHFPKNIKILTPKEMIDIINK